MSDVTHHLVGEDTSRALPPLAVQRREGERSASPSGEAAKLGDDVQEQEVDTVHLEGHELSSDEVRRLLLDGRELVLGARAVELLEDLGRQDGNLHLLAVGIEESLVGVHKLGVALLLGLRGDIERRCG